MGASSRCLSTAAGFVSVGDGGWAGSVRAAP